MNKYKKLLKIDISKAINRNKDTLNTFCHVYLYTAIPMSGIGALVGLLSMDNDSRYNRYNDISNSTILIAQIPVETFKGAVKGFFWPITASYVYSTKCKERNWCR